MAIDSKNISVHITSGTIVKAILIMVLFAALFVIRDILLVVLGAVVLASAIEPATQWFERHKIKRVPSVILMYVVIGLFLIGMFVYFIPVLLGETVQFLQNIPESINLSEIWSPIENARSLVGESSTESVVQNKFSIRTVITDLDALISGTSEGFLKTAGVFFGGVFSFILIVVLSFYLAVQRDGVGNFLKLISPIKHHVYLTDLWKRSQRKIGYWMQGQILLAVLIGVLVYLGLKIIGLKYELVGDHALLLAALAAGFELIPIFGPILAAIPAVIIGFGDGGIAAALVVVGLYVIVQQFENHLFYPLVVRKIVGISPIVVILALVIGAKLAGILGALLAVPLSAALMEFVNDLEKGKRDHSLESV